MAQIRDDTRRPKVIDHPGHDGDGVYILQADDGAHRVRAFTWRQARRRVPESRSARWERILRGEEKIG